MGERLERHQYYVDLLFLRRCPGWGPFQWWKILIDISGLFSYTLDEIHDARFFFLLVTNNSKASNTGWRKI